MSLPVAVAGKLSSQDNSFKLKPFNGLRCLAAFGPLKRFEDRDPARETVMLARELMG